MNTHLAVLLYILCISKILNLRKKKKEKDKKGIKFYFDYPAKIKKKKLEQMVAMALKFWKTCICFGTRFVP